MGLLTVRVRMPWSPRECNRIQARDPDTEIARHLWRNHRLLPPTSPRKNAFDWLLLLLVVFNCLEIPFYLVFELPHVASISLRNFDFFVDAVFALDFFRNFITSYYVDEQIVTSRTQIIQHYAATWMLVDAVAIIPWDEISISIRFLRLLRLLRCATMPSFSSTFMFSLRIFILMAGCDA